MRLKYVIKINKISFEFYNSKDMFLLKRIAQFLHSTLQMIGKSTFQWIYLFYRMHITFPSVIFCFLALNTTKTNKRIRKMQKSMRNTSHDEKIQSKIFPQKRRWSHLALHIQNTLLRVDAFIRKWISLSCRYWAIGEMKKWSESVRAEIENKSKRWWVRFDWIFVSYD